MGLRVLVIDDDQVQLTLFERVWSRLRPEWCITTQLATANFEGDLTEGMSSDFNLVVLDERLGSQQGSACAAGVARRCLDKDGVLVLMTGSPETVAVTDDVVAAVVGKPFSLAETEDFLQCLERTIETRQRSGH